MKRVDVRYSKRCAFCKHWYDPSNSAIRPVNPKIGSWEYDEAKSSQCMKNSFNVKRGSWQSCSDWVCKV